MIFTKERNGDHFVLRSITCGQVYAGMKEGMIKIGFTRRNVGDRLQGKIKLIASEWYARGEDALARERELHKIFAPYRQGRTEWFAITKQQLKEHFPNASG